jgi:hypothetical protein
VTLRATQCSPRRCVYLKLLFIEKSLRAFRDQSGKPVLTGNAELEVDHDSSAVPPDTDMNNITSFQAHHRKLLSPGFNVSSWLPSGSISRSVAVKICTLLGSGISSINVKLPKTIVDEETGEPSEFFMVHDVLVRSFTGCGSTGDIMGSAIVDNKLNTEFVCRGGSVLCYVYSDPKAYIIPPDLSGDLSEWNNRTVEIVNTTETIQDGRRLLSACVDVTVGTRTHYTLVSSKFGAYCPSEINSDWLYIWYAFTCTYRVTTVPDKRTFCLDFFTQDAYVSYKGDPVCGLQYQYRYFSGAFYKWCKFPGVDIITAAAKKNGVPSLVFDLINFALGLIGKGSLDGSFCASNYNVYPFMQIVDNCNCKDSCSCFPSFATVEVQDKGVVRMDRLQYGDRVKVLRPSGEIGFEEVYLFGHKDGDISAAFVNIETENGFNLYLTPGHFASVCLEGCEDKNFKTGAFRLIEKYAGEVNVGEIVVSIDSSNARHFTKVTSISTTNEMGLFNPYVRGGGHIVVDGVVASVHSSWILDRISFIPRSYLPFIYDAILLPVYGLYSLIGPEWSNWIACKLRVHAGGDAEGHALLFVYAASIGLPMISLLAFRSKLSLKRTG